MGDEAVGGGLGEQQVVPLCEVTRLSGRSIQVASDDNLDVTVASPGQTNDVRQLAVKDGPSSGLGIVSNEHKRRLAFGFLDLNHDRVLGPYRREDGLNLQDAVLCADHDALAAAWGRLSDVDVGEVVDLGGGEPCLSGNNNVCRRLLKVGGELLLLVFVNYGANVYCANRC